MLMFWHPTSAGSDRCLTCRLHRLGRQARFHRRAQNTRQDGRKGRDPRRSNRAHCEGLMPIRNLRLLACLMVTAAPGVLLLQQAVAAGRADDSAGTVEGKRIALVIGNGRYSASPLTNPPNDAELIASTLRALGFEVQLQKNTDQATMKRGIMDFGAALEKAGADAIGLFYYAGHGVQLSGRNYLIPVGANIARDADVEIEAVSADWVLEQMRYARNRLNFVILDACRNNPFARSFRSADGGLAKMDAPAGVLIAYSTAPGDVAADGEGRNSPYTEALAHAMRDSDEPAELMFKQARDEVRRRTAERQTPWESSSLTGRNFYFATAAHAPVPAPVPSASVAASVSAGGPVRAPAPTAAAGTNPKAANDPWADSAPIFMSDGLCKRAVGDWRLANDTMHGIARLDQMATGISKIDEKPGTTALSWVCNALNRDFVIKYDGGTVHKVRMDGSEKLLFGYDQAGKTAVYTR